VNMGELVNSLFFVFIFFVLFTGFVVQQELLHISVSESMGCSTETHLFELDKGFLVGVESSCTGLTEQELLHLKTRQWFVDILFYGLNLLVVPLSFITYKVLKKH